MTAKLRWRFSVRTPFLGATLWKHRSSGRIWNAILCWLLSLHTGSAVLANEFEETSKPVGRTGPNEISTPVNQLLTPAGKWIETPDVRPQAIALSPDARILVTAGLTRELLVLDPVEGKILQRVPFPLDKAPEAEPPAEFVLDPNNKAQLSYTGLKFSGDGSRLYLSNVNGDIKVFAITNGNVSPLFSLPLPPANAPKRVNEIPAGIAVSRDGKKLYVALNLSNRLTELDAQSGRVLRMWNVGVAPFDVVLARGKVYVSNWGGRRPAQDSITGPAGRGTLTRVDARGIANEGTVSVIELNNRQTSTSDIQLSTGLRTSAMALSPNERWLVVANAGSDTLSVIDTRTDKIIETICARQNPADLFGAQPNALAFDRWGRRLFVCNGTQNAVAILRFNPGDSRMLGLIPVGWFPGAIAFDAKRKTLCIANIKGITTEPERAKQGRGEGFNTHQYRGSISLVRIPSQRELAVHTETALNNLRYPLLELSRLPARTNQPARPVPERAGEPGVFKHVIYVIKENRTYDQVLGDVKAGNGNADLCIFGERITPNQHKLVREFVLLDNTYCSGILSADGHNWTDAGIATDYVERSFAGWPRSYPSGGDDASRDALAYSPAGFIWDNVLAHGKTFRNCGEFTTTIKRWKDPNRKAEPTFIDCYRDFVGGANAIEYRCEPDIESLQPYVVTNTLGWDLDVPDVWRAAQFIQWLRQCEAANSFPAFTTVWLPNDHTSGTKAGVPTPAAQVADNDLALGQIVEAVSHSALWKDTCIFVIEDDPQNGWDHVSGYRTTAYVISPWTKRGAVIHTQYNTTSLLRTMELMLGLPPMNQMDATATPMFDCFAAAPDYTPFDVITNNVPLDQLNPPPKRVSDATLRKEAYASARLPLKKADQCAEGALNRILWHAMKGSRAAYPAWAVKIVDDD